MICFEDKTFCNKDTCKKYLACSNSFYVAAKRQANMEPKEENRLPYAVRDMSDVCEKYKPYTLG